MPVGSVLNTHPCFVQVESNTVARQNWCLILHPLMVCFVLFPAGQQHRHTPQQSQTCSLQAPWRWIDRTIGWDQQPFHRAMTLKPKKNMFPSSGPFSSIAWYLYIAPGKVCLQLKKVPGSHLFGLTWPVCQVGHLQLWPRCQHCREAFSLDDTWPEEIDWRRWKVGPCSWKRKLDGMIGTNKDILIPSYTIILSVNMCNAYILSSFRYHNLYSSVISSILMLEAS